MSASAVRAGGVYVEIGADAKGFKKALDNVAKEVADLGRKLQGIGLAFAAAGGAAVTGMVAATKAVGSAGSALMDMSKRTGLSVEALGRLGFIAEHSGATLDDVAKGMLSLNKTLDEASGGSKEASAAFAQLGLTAGKLSAMSAEDRFYAIVRALNAIPDPAVRAALAMKVFGKNGVALLPMIANGTADMRELAAEAERLGLVMSTKDAKAASAFEDSVNTLHRAVGSISNAIGSALAPSLTEVANLLAINASAVAKFIKENAGLIQGALKVAVALFVGGTAVANLGTAMVAVTKGLQALKIGLGVLIAPFAIVIDSLVFITSAAVSATISALSLAAGFAPLILVLGAVAAGFVALRGSGQALEDVGHVINASFDGLSDMFQPIAKAAVGAFNQIYSDATAVFTDLTAITHTTIGGVMDAFAMGDLQAAGEMLWLGVQAAFQRGSSAVMSYMDPFIAELQNAFSFIYQQAADTVDGMWTWLSKAFNTGVATIKGILDNMIVGVMNAFTDLMTGVQTSWNYVQSFFKKGFDAKSENEKVRTKAEAEKQARRVSMPGIDQRVVEATNQNREMDAEFEKRKAGREQAVTDAERSRREANAQRQGQREAGLADTMARMDDARQRIANNRADFDAEQARMQQERQDAESKRIQETAAGIGGSDVKSQAVGTFSSVNLGGMGFGSSLAERTAKAAEETAKGVKELVSQGGGKVAA